jgi:hypothetical protein
VNLSLAPGSRRKRLVHQMVSSSKRNGRRCFSSDTSHTIATPLSIETFANCESSLHVQRAPEGVSD